MNTQTTGVNGATRNKRVCGGTRIVLLLFVVFVVGLICGGYAHYRYSTREAVETAPVQAQDLSESTLVSTATPVAPAVPVSAVNATVDPVLNEELVRTIPDLEKHSFDEAAKVLREASLAEFTAAVREMQSKVQEAQSQLTAAQQANSDADLQTAMKQLQRVQSEQTEKLKQISAQLQVRITALKRLKGVNHSTRR